MSKTLLKRVGAVEDQLWANAQPISLPSDDESEEFFKAIVPLDTPLYSAWLKSDPENAKQAERLERIPKSLPPIHPSFLPDENLLYRRGQWALHNRKEYREASDELWCRFLAYVRANYDLSAGLLAIALQLFADDIDYIAAVQDYIGFPLSRDAIADGLIRQWKHVGLARIDTPDASNDDVWLRASIATELEVWGRTVTGEELQAEWKEWRTVGEDMKAGKHAGDLAAKLRAMCEQFPRRVNVREYEK